jgi:hypothetical protein
MISALLCQQLGNEGVMSFEFRYLLIVACSQRKRPDTGLLPAIERYDGVNFRVIRKAMREGRWSSNINVLILSARHGLIRADKPIAYYDERMTRDRGLEHRESVLATLQPILSSNTWREVFVNLGRDYLVALSGLEQLLPSGTTIKYAKGGIGRKMQAMKNWIDSISS